MCLLLVRIFCYCSVSVCFRVSVCQRGTDTSQDAQPLRAAVSCCHHQGQSYRFSTNCVCYSWLPELIKTDTDVRPHTHTHTKSDRPNWMLVATHGVSMATASSGQASSMGRVGPGRSCRGNLPIALGIWFQLKWKSDVLDWIMGVEPLNGQTFL